MSNGNGSNQIVQKLWNFCNVLRDDGLSYQDYLEQLVTLLFLKMADERAELTAAENPIPAGYRWSDLAARRNLGEACFEKVEDATGSVDVSGSQLPVPKVSALTLEAEQRVVGGSAALDGVVADACLLLSSVDHQHGGVYIEDDPRRRLWAHRQTVKKAIVERAELRDCCGGNAQQEPPQRCSVWITRQPSEVLEHAILSQQLSRFDAFKPEDHRIHKSQKHLSCSISIVALHQLDLSRHRTLEADARKKPMQEIHSAVGREVRRSKPNRQLSGTTWHLNESYLKGNFHSKQPEARLCLSGGG